MNSVGESHVTDIIVDMVRVSSAVIRWRLDCSMRTGLFNSFVVEYCESSKAASSCIQNVTTVVVDPQPGVNSYQMTNLNPFSQYKVRVSVKEDEDVFRSKLFVNGDMNDNVLFRTLSAAPGSSPSLFRTLDISSKKALLTWSPPPLQKNGEICKYQVKIFSENNLNSPIMS